MQNEISHTQTKYIFSLVSEAWETEKDELKPEERSFDVGAVQEDGGGIEHGIREEFNGWPMKTWKPQV